MNAAQAGPDGARGEWRLAGAPISWGVCEVPGWGATLPAGRVLAEMAQLGLRATELGAPGWLPTDAAGVCAALAEHDLSLVGGFVPLVLHEASADDALAEAERIAGTFAEAGADTFVAAAIVDAGWSPRVELDAAGWDRLCERLDLLDALAREHGLTLALHPHVGTLIERPADVEAVLARSRVGWCFDPGHLAIGGIDPVAFLERNGERVVHVHLKDVDAAVAARLRAGELTLLEAARAGLFVRLGEGDARIAEAVARLADARYAGWIVFEQDTAIETPPPLGEGPLHDVAASIDFLRTITDRGRG